MLRTFVHSLPLLAIWLAWQGACPLPSICGPPGPDGSNKSGRFAVCTSWRP